MATVATLTAACAAAGGTPAAADADVLSYIVAALADADGLDDAVDSFGEMLVESGAVGDAAAARKALAALVPETEAAAPAAAAAPQKLQNGGVSVDELTTAYTKVCGARERKVGVWMDGLLFCCAE